MTATSSMIHHSRVSTNKTWSITAVSQAGGAVAFHRRGEVLAGIGGVAGGGGPEGVGGTAESGGGRAPASISPVEHLLVAAAGCLALSCRAVLNTRQLATASVEVTATGEKSPDPPSRLARISLTVRFVGGGIDAATASSVIAEAERLCTVTNTLLGSPVIEVSSVSHKV